MQVIDMFDHKDTCIDTNCQCRIKCADSCIDMNTLNISSICDCDETSHCKHAEKGAHMICNDDSKCRWPIAQSTLQKTQSAC